MDIYNYILVRLMCRLQTGASVFCVYAVAVGNEFYEHECQHTLGDKTQDAVG